VRRRQTSRRDRDRCDSLCSGTIRIVSSSVHCALCVADDRGARPLILERNDAAHGSHDGAGAAMHLDDKLSSLGNTESQSPTVTVAELVRDGAVLGRLHRIAESRARLPKGSPDAQDLVAGVIADLATGAIAPDLAMLRSQAIRLVRQRADKYQRDAEKSVTCYLDDAPAEALADHADDDTEDATAVELPRRRDAAIAAVQALALGDKPVLQLLELYARGFTRRRDALSVGLSPAVYRTARERLLAYAQRARSELATQEARSEDDGHRKSRIVRNAAHQQEHQSKRAKHRSA